MTCLVVAYPLIVVAVFVVTLLTRLNVAQGYAVVPWLQSPVARTRLGATSTATTYPNTIVTGPGGRAATSFEEDLRLTLQIILDHETRSTTVSTEQLVQQVTAAAAIDDALVPTPSSMDVRVPYDAAAKLAFEATDKTMPYTDFQIQYEADAVAAVKAKKMKVSATVGGGVAAATKGDNGSVVVDIRVSYDAAAKLAYEASSDQTKIAYVDFKAQYEANAVGAVKAKKLKTVAEANAMDDTKYAIDITVPYDAASRLAFEKSDKTMVYADFRAKFETDAIADVTAKRTNVN